MGDRHERIFLLAHQRIFFHQPEIGSRLLLAAGSARALFEGDRREFLSHFQGHESLWQGFLGFRDLARARRDLDEVERRGLHIIGINDERYPALLRETAGPPALIIARGEALESLNMPVIAMVGSRRASSRGRCVAAEIAQGLASLGYAVASGMAYGIDSASHRGALAGGGPTIAVMGCGPDIVYPPGNRELADRIASSGLIITEFPLGEEPFRSNFPQRNRVISGMSLATVIVEAAEKSGSLITARYALEQDREVTAVPGAGGTFGARGVNRLIRDGAALVETADDVDEIVNPLLSGRSFAKRSGHSENDVDKDQSLLRAVPACRAATVDEIVASSGMSASDVLAALTKFMVEGAVEEAPGRRWRRARGGRCRTR